MTEGSALGTIRRVRFAGVGDVEIERTERVHPGAGEAVVRVTSCGLCGSDASMLSGRHPVIRPPLVPGHEIVGVLARVGSGEAGDVAVGARVAVLPQVGCGTCRECRRGHPRLCPRMRLIGGQITGGAADEVLVPTDALVVIPDDVPAAVTPIVEPLAVAAHAVSRVADLAGAATLVVGGGPIGMLVALAARADGAVVTLVEPVLARRQIVAHFGVPVTDATPGTEFDVVFDCVGGRDLPAALLRAVAPGGTLVLVGVAGAELAFDGILLQRQERAILGSHMYTRADFEAAIRLLAGGLLPVDEESLALLFDRRALEDAVDAFDDLLERRSPAVKILLEP